LFATQATTPPAVIPLVDEVGYIPFDLQAANPMFSLVSSRYERASLTVTSNKPFSAWGEIFGDEIVAAAMIDRFRGAVISNVD
jgi:DNA replication protein DnaC